MTRNDAIRKAVSVMAQDDTGEALARIFIDTCPFYAFGGASPDLMDDVKDTIKTMRACLTRLNNELKAIDV